MTVRVLDRIYVVIDASESARFFRARARVRITLLRRVLYLSRVFCFENPLIEQNLFSPLSTQHIARMVLKSK